MLLLAAALLTANLGDFTLDSGKIIKDLQIAYRTYGEKNADASNVILFPTWFNGKTEGLETYISGANPFVDPKKFFIIAVDAIGNTVSTSPSNSKLQKGKAFPRFTMADIVRSQHILLTKHLNINQLHAVVGISMGGMQAFEWMGKYPTFMKKGISIVGTPQMTGADAALWMEMATKSAAGGGDGAKKGNMQQTILNGIIGVIGARAGGGASTTPNPEDAFYQFNAMASHNVTRLFKNSLEATAKGIVADVLLFVADNDKAVSGEIPLQFAKFKGARVVHLLNPEGHNAYKIERELISREALAFLDPSAQPPAKKNSIFQ